MGRLRERRVGEFVVCGHCCESGDIWTPAPGSPEELRPRKLLRPEIGDLVVIGGTGAYCASMSTAGYCSYPRAPEVLINPGRRFKLIRKRQDASDLSRDEINI